MFRDMLSCALVLAVTCTITAQETAEKKETKSQVDPSSTWKWERSFGDNEMDYTLRFMRNDKGKLTGTYAVKRNGTESEPAKVEDAKLDGNKLTFSVHRKRNDREFTINYEGVVSDAGIKGLTKVNFGGEDREFEWKADRVVTTADIVGTWQLRFERNGNVREPTIKISKDGEQLKGSLTSARGERELRDVRIKDNQLTFQIVFERNGESFTIAYKASPRGNSLKGTIESNFGGEIRTTEIEGKRLPEKSITEETK